MKERKGRYGRGKGDGSCDMEWGIGVREGGGKEGMRGNRNGEMWRGG